jgi:TctA family transporter
MALMIGAMMIQGLAPGPKIAVEQPQLFWGLIASMWIGNLMLVVLNLPLIGIWVRLLTIPYRMLFPGIIAFSVIGVFTVHYNIFDLYALAAFGVLGFVLIKLDCEPAPLLLGFVLGPMLEEQLRRAMLISRGDPSIFLSRPLSATLLCVAALMLIFVAMPTISKKREEVFVEGD